jgi:glycine/D-amino acid oxidase-like deaminating enzyme
MNSYQVSRLPADRAGSGWYELLPAPPPAQPLQQSIDADWVIIGAGFAGLAAARRLAQRVGSGCIAVLDAQRVGWGAAGRNSGFMIDLSHELNSAHYAGALDHDRRQIRRNRAAIEFTGEAVEEFGLQRFFSPCGKLHGAASSSSEKALAAFCRHLDALGESYTWLDPEVISSISEAIALVRP